MTAPAGPRTPTPGDLSRRTPPPPAPPRPARAPQAPAADAALAPGKLTRDEHFRRYFMLGLRASRMHAHARLVGHDLMWRASHTTGRLSPGQRPTTGDLAAATGLAPRQIQVALQNLYSRGWIRTERPATAGEAASCPVVAALTIPAAVLQQIRATTGKPRRRAPR
ncbi:hypothetical protein SZN_09461 [Streptomyces zinciresistens K42]|uniref:Uncharacterized protein n=1 Tax=Streptomyces zinciresistens K42 TaxID=700597 RepID=G2G8S4_9ACTN|nr:hypothetical protein [Streptomyces zinciresistens]EGX60139.1 hypothetical protein SZN_09461 [Streptomyces zinciresistens K42]